MHGVVHKQEVGTVDGTPNKRLFWSIISDYGTSTALCELIDNAVDLWTTSTGRSKLRVSIQLDISRQLIQVTDNAGGVSRANLNLLIAPGGSNNSPDAASIGIFGVGSKRAVVALAETVSIKTHRRAEKSFQLDITKDWLLSPNWDMPIYEIPDIPVGSTEIQLSALRRPITGGDIDSLITHLGQTYANFLSDDFQLIVNGRDIKPISFENWAYPKGHEPRNTAFQVHMPDGGDVNVQIIGGLIRDRDPFNDNYGVYFYCNDRLIARHLKEREVGYFVSSEAGVPHPDASLCRVIVKLHGPAKLMPWNSSKTAINYIHPIFSSVRPNLIPLVSHYSSLSRRFKTSWDEKVFRHKSGQIHDISAANQESGTKLILPDLPKVNKSHVEHLVSNNKLVIKDSPWTLGLVEAVAASDLISKQKLQTKNRIALILLDSNFEIALKEFIVHRTELFPKSQFDDVYLKGLFNNRDRVIDVVDKKISLPSKLQTRAKHYYAMRNKLIHERATISVPDSDIENYRDAISKILKLLFKVNV